jgi:hypothetical protein
VVAVEDSMVVVAEVVVAEGSVDYWPHLVTRTRLRGQSRRSAPGARMKCKGANRS